MASAPFAPLASSSDPIARAPAARLPAATVAFGLLFYAFLLPPQFNVNFGTWLIAPYRLAMMVGVFYAISAFATQRIRFRLADTAMVLSSAWVVIALMNTMGFDTALSGGGGLIIDIAFAYFFGRAAVRTPNDFRALLIIIAPGIVVLGGLLMMESLSRRPFVQEFGTLVAGGGRGIPYNERLGLMRALGPFPHPIHAGIFIGSFLPLYILSGIRGWPRWMTSIASVMGVFTFSSAAFLALVVGTGLVIYNWLGELIANLTWRLFLGMTVIALFLAEFGTSSGVFRLLVRFAAFNSASSYNRVQIWQFGSQSVAKYPVFGIGYNDWERPSYMLPSVDNYWLLLAMQYGLLPSLLLIVLVLIAVVRLGRMSGFQPQVDRRLYIGFAICLAVFALGAFSVALWLSVQAWFFGLVGMAISLGYDRTGHTQVQTAKV